MRFHRAVVVHNRQFAVARRDNRFAFRIDDRFGRREFHNAVKARFNRGHFDVLRRAAHMERKHGKLSPRFADGLSRNNADRFADVDGRAARQIATVAFCANAVFAFARQRRTDVNLFNAGSRDFVNVHFVDQLHGFQRVFGQVDQHGRELVAVAFGVPFRQSAGENKQQEQFFGDSLARLDSFHDVVGNFVNQGFDFAAFAERARSASGFWRRGYCGDGGGSRRRGGCGGNGGAFDGNLDQDGAFDGNFDHRGRGGGRRDGALDQHLDFFDDDRFFHRKIGFCHNRFRSPKINPLKFIKERRTEVKGF